MGKVNAPQTERNQAILEDIKTMSLGMVALKYDLTVQRVHQIISKRRKGNGVQQYRPKMETSKKHE